MQIIGTKINSIIEIAEGILNFADNFSFVIREENDVSSNITKLISDLSTFLIEEKDSDLVFLFICCSCVYYRG